MHENTVHYDSECGNFPIAFVSESYAENHLSCFREKDLELNRQPNNKKKAFVRSSAVAICKRTIFGYTTMSLVFHASMLVYLLQNK